MMQLQKAASTVASGHVVLPRVNLLPPEIAEQARFRRVQGGLGVTLVLALGAVGVLYAGASGSASDAQTRLDSASAERAGLVSQTAKYRDVTSVYARRAAGQQMLVQAMGAEVRYSRYLNDLTVTIPDGVWITNATFTQAADGAGAAAATAGAAAPAASAATTAGTASTAATAIGTVTLTGVAYEHDDVATWLESLGRQKGYATASLSSSAEVLLGTRKVVNWSMTVTLTTDALSRRYTKAGG